MPLGILNILGAIGNAGADQAIRNQAITSARQKKEEAERKRQEQEQQRLLTGLPPEVRVIATQKSIDNPNVAFETNVSEAIKEFQNSTQASAEVQQQDDTRNTIIKGLQGIRQPRVSETGDINPYAGDFITEGEAQSVASARQAGGGRGTGDGLQNIIRQGGGVDPGASQYWQSIADAPLPQSSATSEAIEMITKQSIEHQNATILDKLSGDTQTLFKEQANRLGGLTTVEKAEAAAIQYKLEGNPRLAKIANDRADQLRKREGNDKDANGVKLGEVAQRRVNGANTFLSSQKLLIPLLEDENIAKMVGPAAGRWNRSKQGGAGAYFVAADEFIGQYTGTDLVDDVPPEFTQVQGLLVNMADAFLRMRTGAAANNDEVKRVSREIMGDISLTAPQIITMMKTLAVLSRTERDVILSGKELDAASIDLAASELRAVISTIKRDKRKKQQKVDKEQAKAEAEEKKRLEAELEELNERERSFEE